MTAKKQAGTASSRAQEVDPGNGRSDGQRATKPRVSDQAVTRHLIVGVAASAGGLEAFTALLKRLLLDTGFGFVLVQDFDPQHDSAPTHLLTRDTSMPVREVTNNLQVQANSVYVIPPNSNFCIANAVLEPQPRR